MRCGAEPLAWRESEQPRVQRLRQQNHEGGDRAARAADARRRYDEDEGVIPQELPQIISVEANNGDGRSERLTATRGKEIWRNDRDSIIITTQL